MMRYSRTLFFVFIFTSQWAWASPIEKKVTYYSDHKKATERFYQDGKSVGLNRSWYPNGKLQTETKFSKPNEMEVSKVWYDNGQLQKIITYKDGHDVQTKIYRKTGQIYLNRIWRNGRLYGLPGGRACEGVKQ